MGKAGLVRIRPGNAFEFTADGGGAALKLSRYAGKADALSFECVDLVSFVLGQVFVGHGAR